MSEHTESCGSCQHWTKPSCGYGFGNCSHLKGKGLTGDGNTCKYYKKQDTAKPIMTDRQLLDLRADIEEGVSLIVRKDHYYTMEAQNKDLIIILTELSKNMQTQRNNGNMVFPGWFKEPIQKIEAAIEKASP